MLAVLGRRGPCAQHRGEQMAGSRATKLELTAVVRQELTRLAAVNSFGTLGHADLAQLAGQILGVESEHRALGRVVAGDDPANNVTLEVASFTAVGDAGAALAPYLTGKGFTGGATAFIALPTQAQITTVVGSNASS